MNLLPPPALESEGWQRLDPRMLLVMPTKELLRFLPALVGLFVAGAASGGMGLQWQLLGIAVPVGVGLMRYLTTAYRITGDRVELRRGLLDRHLLSVRLDRVRTVDLTASPIHRALGLSTVRIGTGTASTNEEDRVDLDGLPTDRARTLRHDLLLAGSSAPDPALGRSPADDSGARLLELDPVWARYAPLTSSGVVVAGATLAVASQVVGEFGLDVSVEVHDAGRLLWLLPAVAVGLVVAVAVLAVAGYLVTNWGFTLTRARDGTWHLRRGLLTTRETSIDDARVGGVTVGEPLGLRLAGAARLSAVVTGLDRERHESSVLVPPAPRPVVDGVAATVLGTGAPVTGDLVGHGPAAARRRWTRALVPAALAAVVLVGTGLASGGTAWLLPSAVLLLAGTGLLAADRARALGHALVDGYVVARSGSLFRRREVLATGAVIGWTFRATWFQRRAGLTSLVATTAGGPQSVTVLDVPEAQAVTVAVEALPELMRQFRA